MKTNLFMLGKLLVINNFYGGLGFTIHGEYQYEILTLKSLNFLP
jgi:hypothetical protein